MERCGGDERRPIHATSDAAVVCPKPRRIGLNAAISDQRCRQTEISDSRAMSELLDLILTKGDNLTNQIASSPPFFFGSPPSRVSNPLIEDSQFVCDGSSPLSPAVSLAVSPSSSGRIGGPCARAKYGKNPVAVRIEGFNCLSRDRRSVSAVA